MYVAQLVYYVIVFMYLIYLLFWNKLFSCYLFFVLTGLSTPAHHQAKVFYLEVHNKECDYSLLGNSVKYPFCPSKIFLFFIVSV